MYFIYLMEVMENIQLGSENIVYTVKQLILAGLSGGNPEEGVLKKDTEVWTEHVQNGDTRSETIEDNAASYTYG